MSSSIDRFRTAYFQPDYRNLVRAARNLRPDRFPLYEHIIDEQVMEAILGAAFAELAAGGEQDRRQYIRQYTSSVVIMFL